MRLARLFCGLATLAVIVTTTALVSAETVYDNGPPDNSTFGYDNSAPVFYNFGSTSDSFTLSAPSTTLTGGQVAIWSSQPYGPISSVAVWIGSSPFATDQGGGLVNLTYTPVASSVEYRDLAEGTFALSSPVSLSAGTYWLTLWEPNPVINASYWATSASPPAGTQAGWDYYFPPEGYFPALPASFQLYSQVTPEPSALVALVSALPLLGGVVYLRRRRAKA
jgi:hypothetical protein